MSLAAAPETRPDLLETVRALPAESQDAVLSFALFLRQQQEQLRIAADEAEGERLLSDPSKMANFTKWMEVRAD